MDMRVADPTLVLAYGRRRPAGPFALPEGFRIHLPHHQGAPPNSRDKSSKRFVRPTIMP